MRVLEDDPVLNAGRGSFRNLDGVVEMDAMIMDGRTLALGSVAVVRDVCNPVSLARRVMTDTNHVLLAGDGASRFADAIDFPRCDTSAWPSPRARGAHSGDTVGAVAVDRARDLAVAVSTGGIPRKMPGRIGDSPIAGAGGYADNDSAAVAATGDGEAFTKFVAAKRACDSVAHGATAQTACDDLIATLGRRLGATGWLIALDRTGEVGVAFNTPAMPWAWVGEGGVVRSSTGRAHRR